MNKFIAGALIFLVILVAAVLLLTSFLNRASTVPTQGQPTLIPTTPVLRSGGITTSLEIQQEKKVSDANRIFSAAQDEDVQKFQSKLPISNADFDMAYSESLGQYYIQKKTTEAEVKVNELLQQNNMLDLKNSFPSVFVTVSKPVNAVIQKAEDDLTKARLQQAEDPEAQGTGAPTPATAEQQKDIKLLTDITTAILSIGKKAGGGAGDIANPTELDKIFNEAGNKVGTPPKMLKAIMSIECGRLISSTSPQDILAWSAPGAPGLPRGHGCYQNQGGYGAYGPMQFVPGTFARYGSAVNRYGGYGHAPSIQNIRDSVFAAAELFLLNSGATGPTWTLEQMKRAYVCYAAGCRQYDTGRLGSDTQHLFQMFLDRYNSY